MLFVLRKRDAVGRRDPFLSITAVALRELLTRRGYFRLRAKHKSEIEPRHSEQTGEGLCAFLSLRLSTKPTQRANRFFFGTDIYEVAEGCSFGKSCAMIFFAGNRLALSHTATVSNLKPVCRKR